ncbi:MAG: T9SS type A sorting domain-containing protein [Lentimicrobiaceae bacterium]
MKKAALLFLAFISMSLVSAQNILTDGDFSSTTMVTPYNGGPGPANLWCSWVSDGTEAYATIDAGVCNFHVLNGGNESWQVQLMQWGFPMIQGNYYRLTFDVKADYETWFGVYLGEDGGSWFSLIGYENYYQNATTNWKTISVDFYASASFDYHKFSIELGGQYYNTFYFDNFMLENLGANPEIGILGTSLNGWDVDVDMMTTDWVIYTLSDYPLTNGRLKFRQNNTWWFNWGGSTFPTGFGYHNGPDIPIYNPGNYNITFNRITGEYSFVCVNNCSPYIGISGTAVPPYYDWNNDLQMSTVDGITYTLTSTLFNDGEAIFRQIDDWGLNWGDNTFPSGNAYMNGPNIPVSAGSYKVTFNLLTGEYYFKMPDIGILGSALTGWEDDIDLQSSDGITYTLSNYHFNDGEVKFRQDNNWNVNWGAYEFPKGWGYQDGPNIPVLSGNYDVTFNRITGEYGFVATNCPIPAIQCPETVYAGNEYGLCGSTVYFPDIVPAPNCGGPGIAIIQIAGLPSGSFFPLGITTNEFLLTNESGETASCSFDVIVYDWEPPVITGLSNYFEPLWPPNHKMVHVPIDYNVNDICGNTYTELWVFSSEPENGPGDGDLSPDWEIIDNHNVMLRAERSGTGPGREYYIYIVSHDDFYNYSFEMVIITVPHDQAIPKSEEIANGGQSDSLPFCTHLWPNPGTQNFNLKIESTNDATIEVNVTDVTGRKVLRMNALNKQTILFGNQLLPGIYIVSVSQGNSHSTIKMVKQ